MIRFLLRVGKIANLVRYFFLVRLPLVAIFTFTDFPIQLKTTLKLTKKADCSQISIGQICLAGQEIDCAGKE